LFVATELSWALLVAVSVEGFAPLLDAFADMPEVGLLSASFVALVDALSALLGFAALAFELDGALDVDLPADADALLVVPDVALVESGFASSCPATPPIAPPATAPTGPPTTAPPTAPDAAPTVVACSFLVMRSHVEHPASATIASAMALFLKPVDVMKISFPDRRSAPCGRTAGRTLLGKTSYGSSWSQRQWQRYAATHARFSGRGRMLV